MRLLQVNYTHMYRPMSYSNHQVHRHLSCKVMQIDVCTLSMTLGDSHRVISNVQAPVIHLNATACQ